MSKHVDTEIKFHTDVEDDGYIATVGGGKFWPLLGKGDLNIKDIAHALGMICRFQGHVKKFSSVAEHSVLVSWLAPPNLALTGLLHDAAEAYLTDLPTPVKRQLPGYYEAEERIEKRIADKFGCNYPKPNEVRVADLLAMNTEAFVLMDFDFIAIGYGDPLPNAVEWIHNWAPEKATAAFLHRFEQLTGGKSGGLL